MINELSSQILDAVLDFLMLCYQINEIMSIHYFMSLYFNENIRKFLKINFI